jgi:hypothetical protein
MSSNSVNGKSNNKMFNMILKGLVVFIVLLFVYTSYVGFQNYQKYSPYLIDGISDGTIAQKFPAYKVPLSSDSAYGIEFTYSFWIYIKDVNFSTNATMTTNSCSSSDDATTSAPLLHIFHKGSYDYVPNGSSSNGSSGVNYPLLEMPGVWLYPNTNKLNIRFNTYENVIETSDVGNIPLNMWVNINIVLIGKSVDVYINGNLKKRTKLMGVPKINYGDFYVTNWGGFQGYLSKLRYFNYAIEPFMIDQIFSSGPSTKYTNTNPSISEGPPQLSSNYWMTSGYPNSVGAPK